MTVKAHGSSSTAHPSPRAPTSLAAAGFSFDVTAAYLYAELHEEVFMSPPQGLPGSEGKVCKLGLQQSAKDPCLFFVKNSAGEAKALLTTHVDDLTCAWDITSSTPAAASI